MNQQLEFLEDEIISGRVILIQTAPASNQKRIRIVDDYGTSCQTIIACVVCDDNPGMIRVIVDSLKRLFMVEKECENGTYNPLKAFTNGFKY